MSVFPKRRFPRSTNIETAAAAPPRNEYIIEPTLGVNVAQPASQLALGETPLSSNWIVEEGYLTPRSGLTQFGGDTKLGTDVGLLCAEHVDVNANRYPIIASPGTVSVFGIDGASAWSALSYVPSHDTTEDFSLSASSTSFFYSTGIYSADDDENIFVFSASDVPLVWVPGEVTYSEHSDFQSVESVGRIPYAVDNRLCVFNCGADGVDLLTRVRWSERGIVSDFSTSGAGFEDLVSMRGEGTAAVPREVDAILFSNDEIWLQRPRRDAFAFDFTPLSKEVGCPYPATIANTPFGVIFLDRSIEPYLVIGNRVLPIGSKMRDLLRDEITNPIRAFGFYNRDERRYQLHYSSGLRTEQRCDRAFYLDLSRGLDPQNPSWLRQDFVAFELGAGEQVAPNISATPILFRDVPDQFQDVPTAFEDMLSEADIGLNSETMVVSSHGTAYRLLSTQLDDVGSAITATWSTGALVGEDRTRSQIINDSWFHYKADSAATLEVLSRGEPDETFRLQRTVTLPTALQENRLHVPFVDEGDMPQIQIRVDNGTRPRIGAITIVTNDSGQF